jgi:hypothetical protein
LVATRRPGEFFAKLADEDVNDFELGFSSRRFGACHPAVQMVQEHLLRYCRTLAQAEQFENAVFFVGQMHLLAVYRDNPGVKIDDEVPGSDCRSASRCGTAPVDSRRLGSDS